MSCFLSKHWKDSEVGPSKQNAVWLAAAPLSRWTQESEVPNWSQVLTPEPIWMHIYIYMYVYNIYIYMYVYIEIIWICLDPATLPHCHTYCAWSKHACCQSPHLVCGNRKDQPKVDQVFFRHPDIKITGNWISISGNKNISHKYWPYCLFCTTYTLWQFNIAMDNGYL